MSVTRICLDTFHNNLNYDIRQDQQILGRKRIIYLNDVRFVNKRLRRNPLIDIFFRLHPTEKYNTNVSITVVNLSAVRGSIHTSRHSLIKQNNNVYHGVIYDDIDKINANSLVEFDHFEYSVLVDDDCNGTPGDNKYITVLIPEDTMLSGGLIVDKRITAVPDPIHYDEIDQVRSTDNTEFSYDQKWDDLHCGEINSAFTTNLGRLIDDKTVIYKRSITVEDEEKDMIDFDTNGYEFNTNILLLEISTDIQTSMDRNCITSMKAVLMGEKGFNVLECIQLFEIAGHVNRLLAIQFMEDIRQINDSLIGSGLGLFIYVKDMTSIHIKRFSLNNFNNNDSRDVMRPRIDDFRLMENEY